MLIEVEKFQHDGMLMATTLSYGTPTREGLMIKTCAQVIVKGVLRCASAFQVKLVANK